MTVNASKASDPRCWKKWRDSGAVLFNQQEHPEIMPDEVWITNADIKGVHYIGWRTKRRGLTALDSHGRPLGRRWPNSFPVFARKSELEQAGVLKLIRPT